MTQLDAQNAALQLLDEFDYKEPPVNPIKIANTLGISVYFVKFSDEENNVSGYFDVKKNAIVINEDEYFPRQMFTIAHELGHYRLHKDWLYSIGIEKLYRDQLDNSYSPLEKEQINLLFILWLQNLCLINTIKQFLLIQFLLRE